MSFPVIGIALSAWLSPLTGAAGLLVPSVVAGGRRVSSRAEADSDGDEETAVQEPTLTARGTPLSVALQLGDAPARLTEVLWVLDRVHGDGELPRIPVAADDRIDGLARYRVAAGGPDAGTPVDIRARMLGSHPELSLLHELGHFLDHQTLGQRGEFASVEHTNLAEWRDAVDATGSVNTLRAIVARGTVTVELDGLERVFPVSVRVLEHDLQWQELWARSYAQYMAQAAGQPRLLAQLAAALGVGRRPRLPYTLQWEADDFRPVLAAIERLFRMKGWMI